MAQSEKKKKRSHDLPPEETPPVPPVPNRAHTEMRVGAADKPAQKPKTVPRPKPAPGAGAPVYPPEFPGGGVQVFPMEFPAREM